MHTGTGFANGQMHTGTGSAPILQTTHFLANPSVVIREFLFFMSRLSNIAGRAAAVGDEDAATMTPRDLDAK